MSKCRDLEPFFTAYVDNEAPPPERAHVESHLHACPPCRARVAAERVAREVVCARREGLRPHASQALRSRCAAQHAAPVVRGRFVPSRRVWVPLSLAATLVLSVSGLFVFGFNSPVEAFAAQMAVDHKGCFFFNADRSAADADVAAREWNAKNGWALKVPASATMQGLVLLGVRRCGSTRGRVAHVMYQWHGKPLSVFVLNGKLANASDPARGGSPHDEFSKLGERAVVWSRGDRTYAVVTRGSMPDIQQLAAHIRQTAE